MENMQSFAFDSEIKDGVIKVPNELVSQIHKPVRVEVHIKEINDKNKTQRFSEFLSHQIHVDTLIIPSKDKIHER